MNVGADCYANDILADASVVLTEALEAGTGRFDASDLMPAEVGSGSFWTGMVEYMQGGPDSLQGVLDDIEASWPAVAEPVAVERRGAAASAAPRRRPSRREDDGDVTTRPRNRAEPDERPRRRPAAPAACRRGLRCGARVAASRSSVGVAVLCAGASTSCGTPTPTGFVVVVVAIVVGVGGVFVLFWAHEPGRSTACPAASARGVRPYVFVGPALVILTVFLIYPVINTILISFKDATGAGVRRARQLRVRLHRREHAAVDPQHGAVDHPRPARRRVASAWSFATLADRLRRGEAVAKSMIFLPMAISFVGAAVTFRLIYSFRPEGFGTNIGLLNGIWSGLGQDPVAVAVGAARGTTSCSW